MNDLYLTQSDLDAKGKYRVTGCNTVGAFAVEDSEGSLVYCPQLKTEDGIEIDLSGFTVQGTWHVRFFRGDAGKNLANPDAISTTEAILYALVFG